MIGFTGEQLLAIAEVFCRHANQDIANYAHVFACAAVTDAKFHGISVHASTQQQLQALHRAIVVLQPLSGENEAFAHAACAILQDYTQSVTDFS